MGKQRMSKVVADVHFLNCHAQIGSNFILAELLMMVRDQITSIAKGSQGSSIADRHTYFAKPECDRFQIQCS
jgi:hypothetical protein